MVRKCPFCDAACDGDFRFCPACGRELLTSPTEMPDPYAGMVVGGKYRLGDVIGTGGMGTVYRAEHISLGKQFAVKILNPMLRAEPDLVERFHNEARAASKLSHPNCISVVDFGETETGILYLVMEYLRGQDLQELLEREAPLAVPRIVHIVRQVLAALSEAHDLGIVHRDLKPENVMVEEAPGQGDFVKVLDFGIAQIVGSASRLTRPGLAMGTPEYMAPEQISGHDADSRSDLYAVGVMLYKLLTQVTPFRGDTHSILTSHLFRAPDPPSVLRPDEIPGSLDAVVIRALGKKREERYQSALEFQAALEATITSPGATRPDHAAVAPRPPAPALAVDMSDLEAVSREIDALDRGPRARSTRDALAERRVEIVGREAERERLAALLAPGGPRTVLLVGPPGAGKRTLARDLGERAAAAGRRVLSLRPEPGAPAAALRRLIESLGGTFDPQAPAEGLLAALRGGAAGGPVLLSCEDFSRLSWAARQAVAAAVHAPPGGEFAAVITATRADPSLSGHETLPIGPLAPEESRRVARAIVAAPDAGLDEVVPGPDALPLDIVERAQFVHLLRAAPPADPQDLASAWIRSMSPDQRMTAFALAVLGERAPAASLAAMGVQVEPSGLALPAGDDLAFSHWRVAEWTYAAIPTEVRRDLHRHAAAVESARGAFPAVVADHADKADDPAAAAALEEAGHACAADGDTVAAAVHYRRAFDRIAARGDAPATELARLAVYYADALDPAGNRARAAGLLRDALDRCASDVRASALLYWRLGRLALDAGRADLALDDLEQAQRLVAQVTDPVLASCVWATSGEALARKGEVDRGLDAISEAAAVSPEPERWRYLLLLAEIQLEAGRHDVGLRSLRDAVRMAERAGAEPNRIARDRARTLAPSGAF